ncbi:MAG: hypothetical protein EB059_01720 [Alphaproteobacteria bacterium]|nr:hypothetical protein [Alphaproteobacteria bacterium]
MNALTQPRTLKYAPLSWARHLPACGYLTTPIPVPNPAFLDHFNHLPTDDYAPHAQRQRRFSQYKGMWNNAAWQAELLPCLPFVQYNTGNPMIEGIERHFEPINPACRVDSYINNVLSTIGADKEQPYHLDVHQYRVYATREMDGLAVPEGRHQDGQECVAILVFKRHAIEGAELSLFDLETGNPFHTTIIEENQMIFFDDRIMTHDATRIQLAGKSDKGFRDYMVMNINPWNTRRYGARADRPILG